MRKIKTKEEIEKAESRKKIILGAILVALMIFSTAGYAFFSSPSSNKKEGKLKYNNLEFEQQENGFWKFSDSNGRNEFYTSHNPYETENISVSGIFTIQGYYEKPLYYTGDRRVISEIYTNLQYFSTRVQEVCLENDNKCIKEKDLPVKNCSESIIIIKPTKDINTKPSVKQEDNCVILQGEYSELLKTADAFLFRLFGIN